MSDSYSTLGPGTVLDERYELVEEIARGGFGMVYRARQLNIDREVAIKMIPPEFMDLPDVVQRFEREARLASRLSHPNTITVHDYGQHGDYLFLVMELLEGEDLADVLARERDINLDRIGHIAKQVLKSLHEAHQHKIIHRDLKPENIFLSEISGEKDFVKVVDFGIAKLAMPDMPEGRNDTSRRLTVEGNTVGTPTYMSPEQAAGGEVDARSDLYALGVILYEMAAGRPPFDEDDAAKLMRQHIFKEVPAFPEDLQDCWLESIVRRSMAKEKEDRFQDASEFIQAIEYALEASGGERAFAPTQEQSAVDVDSRDLEEDSLEIVEDDDRHSQRLNDFNTGSHASAEDAPKVDAPNKDAFIQPPSKDGNTSSSILTVLEPSPNEDVIVLDEPKEDGEPPGADQSQPEPAADVSQESQRQQLPRADSSGQLPTMSDAADESAPPRTGATSDTGGRPTTGTDEGPSSGAEQQRASMWDDPEPSGESWEWSGTFDVPDDEFEEEPLTATGYDSGSNWLTITVLILLVGGVAAVAYLYAVGQLG